MRTAAYVIVAVLFVALVITFATYRDRNNPSEERLVRSFAALLAVVGLVAFIAKAGDITL